MHFYTMTIIVTPSAKGTTGGFLDTLRGTRDYRRTRQTF
jgi:hypothetical protein